MSDRQRLRVGIVGCGQIADAHLQEIAKLDIAHVAAVCDVHRDLAVQAAARFHVPGVFDNVDEMLDASRLDVVHVATPAQTHHDLAVHLLERGCHVYIEKPVAIDAPEVESILSTAHRTNRLVCVGHDQLFDPVWLDCRDRVAAGEIGEVRHVESVLGYPLSGQFGALVVSDPNHWVRRLPGGLFHNVISHPLYRITDLMPGAEPAVDAHWFSRGEATFPTELRAHLRGDAVTGALTFDTGIEPQRITRVYGTAGCLEVDFDGQTIQRRRQARLPGAFAKLETPWRQWREAGANLRRNLARFLKSDIHYFAGMGRLFDEFYRAVLHGEPAPIPGEEIVRVTRVMDAIFDQCRGSAERLPRPSIRPESRPSLAHSV